MGRKSQVEKFNAKVAKSKAIDHHIAEQNAKAAMQQNIMETGAEVLKKTTGREDVFAVIARDSMESFIGTWNNSMETVIRETIRTEITAMVQAEMEAAMKGMFQGMEQAVKNMVQSSVKVDTPVASDEPVEFDMTKVVPMDVTIRRAKLKVQASEGPLSQRVKAEEELKSYEAEQEEIAEEHDRHEMYADGMEVINPGFDRREHVPGLDLDGDEAIIIDPSVFRSPHIAGAVEDMKGQDIDGEPGQPKKRITTCKICGEQGHNRRTCPQNK